MNHPSNENIPSRSFSYHAFNFTFVLLLAVFFISLYTVALLKSNSRITLSAAVERNISCSDAVHRAISSRLTRADFEQINTKSDMNSAQYRSLQSYLNELRSLNSTRYLYTAKRGPGGKPIYLIDGLDLEAPDFAYPGTYLEEEMVPYLEAALSGKTIHSQKIIDTTWGHIFTACYPVIASDGTNDILGALCIEIDMEDTYRSIEAINRSSFRIAAAASMIALLLIVISYFYTKKQKSRELTQQQLLEQTAKAAEAANKAKSTFLFNMSHDIRTPMNALLGYSELMKRELTDPKLLDYQEKMEQSGNLLLSIINNVLDMARIESGKVELDEDYVKIRDIYQGIYKIFQAEAEKKGIHLKMEYDVKHEHVICDETKNREIFLNLISNAVKYTASGGRVTIRITELDCDRKDYVRIRTQVIDTGIGMSEEFLPSLFEAFARERNTTDGKIAGTGLGMPIIKKYIDMMYGTIEVESKQGEGSKFTVTLEYRIADKSYYEQDTEKSSDVDETDRISGKHILLAEDNDLNAEIAQFILEDMGLMVDRVEDGVQCVSRIEQKPAGTYDLILMDIQMPNMDGYRATEMIRGLSDKDKATIPIIAMTANAFEEDRKKALAKGMNGHIAKPVDAEKVEKTICSVLGSQSEQ